MPESGRRNANGTDPSVEGDPAYATLVKLRATQGDSQHKYREGREHSLKMNSA